MDLTEKNKPCEDDIEREVILKDDEGGERLQNVENDQKTVIDEESNVELGNTQTSKIVKSDDGQTSLETSEEAESQEKRSNNESNLKNVSPGYKLPTDEELVGGNEPSQTSLETTVDEVIANVDEEKKKDECIDLFGNGLLLKKVYTF